MSDDDIYSASNEVKFMHDSPHFNAGWDSVSNNWNITTDSSASEDYVQSLFMFPTTIAAVGLTVIVLSFIFSCCLCRKKMSPGWQTCNGVIFFIMLVVVATGFVGLGFNEALMMDGVNDALDAVDSLSTTFNELSASSTSLMGSASLLEVNVNNALMTCPEASTLESMVSAFSVSVTDFDNELGDIPHRLDEASDDVHGYGKVTSGVIVGYTAAVATVTLVIYAIAVIGRSHAFANIGNFIAHIFKFTLFILCPVAMVGLVGMADFCMSPSKNIQFSLSTVSSISETVNYYVTCTGTDPIGDSIDEASDGITAMESEVLSLTGPGDACEGNPYLLNMETQLVDAQSEVALVDSLSDCPSIQADWLDFSDSVCGDTMQGAILVWLLLCGIAVVLLVLTIIISAMKPSWKASVDDEESCERRSHTTLVTPGQQTSEAQNSIPLTTATPMYSTTYDGIDKA